MFETETADIRNREFISNHIKMKTGSPYWRGEKMDRKMRRNLRRLTAILLSAVVTMGSSLAAYANEPDMAQTSDSDVADNDEKVRVILPTDAVGIFDFILDPQELIYKTNAAAYEGKLFEEGATLFFKRTEGEALVDYSSTSDAITITNKGEAPIDVVITAGITVVAKDEFAMSDDREFTDDTRPGIYLALTDGETEVPIMGEGEEAASLTITIPPASEEEGANECSFRLTGAANKHGDWSGMGNISFEVAVTWMVVAEEEEENLDEEEMVPENEEANLSKEQVVRQPESDPGEEIVRTIVPVVTDSNAVLDEEERKMPVMEEPSDSKAEEEKLITEENTRSPEEAEKQPEGRSGMNEPVSEDTKEMKDEKDVSP